MDSVTKIKLQRHSTIPEREEADNHVILRTINSAQNDGVESVVILANDTEIILLPVFYAATHLNIFQEL